MSQPETPKSIENQRQDLETEKKNLETKKTGLEQEISALENQSKKKNAPTDIINQIERKKSEKKILERKIEKNSLEKKLLEKSTTPESEEAKKKQEIERTKQSEKINLLNLRIGVEEDKLKPQPPTPEQIKENEKKAEDLKKSEEKEKKSADENLKEDLEEVEDKETTENKNPQTPEKKEEEKKTQPKTELSFLDQLKKSADDYEKAGSKGLAGLLKFLATTMELFNFSFKTGKDKQLDELKRLGMDGTTIFKLLSKEKPNQIDAKNLTEGYNLIKTIKFSTLQEKIKEKIKEKTTEGEGLTKIEKIQLLKELIGKKIPLENRSFAVGIVDIITNTENLKTYQESNYKIEDKTTIADVLTGMQTESINGKSLKPTKLEENIESDEEKTLRENIDSRNARISNAIDQYNIKNKNPKQGIEIPLNYTKTVTEATDINHPENIHFDFGNKTFHRGEKEFSLSLPTKPRQINPTTKALEYNSLGDLSIEEITTNNIVFDKKTKEFKIIVEYKQNGKPIESHIALPKEEMKNLLLQNIDQTGKNFTHKIKSGNGSFDLTFKEEEKVKEEVKVEEKE